jgi:putative flippase GtrA
MTESGKGNADGRATEQLLRYALVGTATNGLGLVAYLVITYLGASPIRTMTGMYVLGATIGFFGNRMWVFSHEGGAYLSVVRYCLAHSAGYLINWLLLFFFAVVLGFPHQFVQAFAVLVVAGFLFVAFRYFVFPGGAGLRGTGCQ